MSTLDPRSQARRRAAHRAPNRGRRRRRVPRYVRLSITLTVTASCVIGIGSLLRGGSDGDTVDMATSQTAHAKKTANKAPAPVGPCATPGPGLPATLAYLASPKGNRFGAVTAASSSMAACETVKRFQQWAQVPVQTGAADATTGQVAERLSKADPAACQPDAARTVCVDLTSQTAWVVENGNMLLGPVPVRTGKAEDATPIGGFAISQKKVHTVSSEYHVPLPFWQRFYEDFGFHASDKDTPLYAPNVRGSHGCVNMLPRDAQALFNLTQIDTPVKIYGKKADY